MKFWIKRITIGLGCLLGLLAIGGAIFEAISRQQIASERSSIDECNISHRRKFPSIGRSNIAAWKEMQTEEATWSSHSRHGLLSDASHYIQFNRPDAVIKAVTEVVNDVRQHR
jgi:hypothetical protein